ncbi:MAG TPA: hypothetical protein VKG01_01405 [Thermoanaerobaculia bacterium]|nr:hypothetical protein [Thermoanaerobaculia bacterium]
MKLFLSGRSVLAVVAVALAALVGGGSGALGLCGPFTDTADDPFCPFVLEIFYMGITTGTTATTYDPTGNVSRLQMAAFLSRSVDGALKRSSRRAALRQYWIPQHSDFLGISGTGANPQAVESDGADIWVASNTDGWIQRYRGSDGSPLGTWTGASSALGVLVAQGHVFVTGSQSPGFLFGVDPRSAPSQVDLISSALPGLPSGITYDGSRIWTANASGSVSIVTPMNGQAWTITTATTGFTEPHGALYDGALVWVTDKIAGTLLRLNPSGAILQTVTVGFQPWFPVFDGTNIWVPNGGNDSISVVRASNGTVLATLTGNGLNTPIVAAFDGQRVLVTNNAGSSVSLWKAADLTTLGSFPVHPFPNGACSDGINFWITAASGTLTRF